MYRMPQVKGFMLHVGLGRGTSSLSHALRLQALSEGDYPVISAPFFIFSGSTSAFITIRTPLPPHVMMWAVSN